ncbi:MAG TPA: AAA family ATPase, partial [Archangium sp.]|uniref:AAA family ATPase n=1 Tax=Archangium sp. TaxID=1872627 RepID=UPI002ED9D3B2
MGREKQRRCQGRQEGTPMRVAWLEIENFRSIKQLLLKGLDKPHVVIEGPNDVGKSNILHALDLAFSTLPILLREAAGRGPSIPGEPSEYPD